MYYTDFLMEASNLSVNYGKKNVLNSVSLKIPKGIMCAVIGPNGAGKSTLLKALLKLLPIAEGEIKINIPTKSISYVPQYSDIDWDFPATVFDVVLMGRYGHLGYFKRPANADKSIAKKTIERLGLSENINTQIGSLSGGQRQRVFMARALAQEAEAYFLDEPFKGVDIETEKVIINILREIKEEGKTIVVVHHNLITVRDYFDWVALINGTVIASGDTEYVLNKYEKGLWENGFF